MITSEKFSSSPRKVLPLKRCFILGIYVRKIVLATSAAILHFRRFFLYILCSTTICNLLYNFHGHHPSYLITLTLVNKNKILLHYFHRCTKYFRYFILMWHQKELTAVHSCQRMTSTKYYFSQSNHRKNKIFHFS